MSSATRTTAIETLHMDYDYDTIAPLGRIGVVALGTDFNLEQDMRRMLPEGVEIFTNRVRNINPVTLENLRAIAPDITRATDGILSGVRIDAVVYGCTSGTAAIGEDKLVELVHAARPGLPVSNPFTAAKAAMDAFGAKRISVLTPYIEEVNVVMAEQLGDAGYDVCNVAGLGIESDTDMTGVPLSVIHDAALQSCHDDADMLFISCTALRAASAIAGIEAALGKPVISSNQALVWHTLQLLGCDAEVSGFGSLFGKRL